MRVTPSAARVDEWALVLAATGIPHDVTRMDTGWALVVAGPDAARAGYALDAYDEENRAQAAPEDVGGASAATPGTLGSIWTGMLVAAVLAGMFVLTGPRASGHPWFAHGSASAERIVSGEVWRVVTALTLHADSVHVLANALASVVLISAVAHALGGGVALALLVLAGAAGNWLTALVHGTRHDSVGASTMTFAAVGLLAGLRIAAGRQERLASRRTWAVAGACLALLLMLGTSEGADVTAHALGLAVGAALGLAVGRATSARAGTLVQGCLAALVIALVAISWLVALSGSPRLLGP